MDPFQGILDRLVVVFGEPATYVLIFFVCGLQLFSAYKSQSFSLDAQKVLAKEAESSVLDHKAVIAIPIVGSLVLLALFYFLDIVFWFLVVLFGFSSFVSFAVFIMPLIRRVRKFLAPSSPDVQSFTCRGTTYEEPFLDVAICALLSGTVVSFWLLTSHWIPLDLLAVALASEAIQTLRLPNLMVACIMLSAFFAYDIFWVFISPLFFAGQSVMVEVAMSVVGGTLPLPLLLIIPRFFSDQQGLLGLGDIVLPGLLLAFLFRVDYAQAKKARLSARAKISLSDVIASSEGSYFAGALLGYGAGLVITFTMLAVLQMGQPALLYLVPFTIVPTLFRASRRGELRMLWSWKSKKKDEDTADHDDDDGDDEQSTSTTRDIEMQAFGDETTTDEDN